jgi:hypothetical protein
MLRVWLCQAMESKLLAVKRELSADYKRRLDALEAEWAARSQVRTQELEATHALKLQQVGRSGSGSAHTTAVRTIGGS